MKCPKCQFDNREEIKFCEECGAKIEARCPACKASVPLERKFCGECGYNLYPAKRPENQEQNIESSDQTKAQPKLSRGTVPIAGERKHVTALFSDLTGYTALSEHLDPEELKEITTQLFDKISKIVRKYDGFIEKFAGDAVLALFGAEKAHEDDPIRAIKAAKEIHEFANAFSLECGRKTAQTLSMHTGINTGLVVTGDVNLESGTHGVAGDTLNVAARISGIGNADEILVGQNTFCQAEGYFEFDEREPAIVKGKSKPIPIYKVLSTKDKPIKIHRLHGLRADLVGRKVEMNQLSDIAARLIKSKKGAVATICGTAGTGKSRLIEEFQASLKRTEIQWLEGQANPYSQNTPYYPLLDLLNRALKVKEGDPPEKIREKVQTGIHRLMGDAANLTPYIGSLFSIRYPEIEEVSPEFWKTQLQKAVQAILASLAQSGPMIICFEDLHWADPSFLELIRLILVQLKLPIFFICSYRPLISLFNSHQLNNMAPRYHEIRLEDLSPSESQIMVESLLRTESIPPELKRFVQDKIEGNPFYIEEVINSLIESNTLSITDGTWQVKRLIDETDISSTIHGVIAGRLDRLEHETKRILQEASVIGRTFLYEILKKITELDGHIDQSLSGLEHLDLIKTKAIQPDLEYIFKHALTQEVVYNGLLKKERQVIHEKIGLVMENLFQDRLYEFYEMLAYHFSHGQSTLKAVDYLVKSGEKSLKRYAVNESHQYFREAFDLISDLPELSDIIKERIIDLLTKWAMVFYYRGDFNELSRLLLSHEPMAETISAKGKRGMFYAFLGMALWMRCEYKRSYEYLQKAIKLGTKAGDKRVIGYAKSWLSWVCAELGRFDEGIQHGKEANRIAQAIKSDHYIFLKSLSGVGYNYFFMGMVDECLKIGEDLIHYGHRHSNIRCLVLGYMTKGSGHYIAGDLPTAKIALNKAVNIAVDPFYKALATFYLSYGFLDEGDMDGAEQLIDSVVSFTNELGCKNLGSFAQVNTGIVLLGKGQMAKGMQLIKKALQIFTNQNRKGSITFMEYLIGKIYLEMVKGDNTLSPITMIKNIGFLIKHVPSAAKNAETQLTKAIETARKVGAKGIMGQAYIDLGLLHKIKKRNEQARLNYEKATDIFEKTGAYAYLDRTREALSDLR